MCSNFPLCNFFVNSDSNGRRSQQGVAVRTPNVSWNIPSIFVHFLAWCQYIWMEVIRSQPHSHLRVGSSKSSHSPGILRGWFVQQTFWSNPFIRSVNLRSVSSRNLLRSTSSLGSANENSSRELMKVVFSILRQKKRGKETIMCDHVLCCLLGCSSKELCLKRIRQIYDYCFRAKGRMAKPLRRYNTAWLNCVQTKQTACPESCSERFCCDWNTRQLGMQLCTCRMVMNFCCFVHSCLTPWRG